ncbi:MAG: nitroreductase family protein [Spirochaetes bacterium]|nr:nitroreductase family protein [Spirochaetota bacterium]
MLREKTRYVAMPPAKFPRVIVNEEKCNGCGRCVKTCPIQLLMLNDNKKSCSNERYDEFRCIYCENCTAVCTKKAIKIEGVYRVTRGYWKNDDLYEDQQVPPQPFEESAGKSLEGYEKKITETERIIYKRRSTRLFQKKQVEPELLHRVIEAGRYAPSAGNNQPWKFIVIQNRDLIEELNQSVHKALKFATFLGLPRAWINKKIPGDKTAKLAVWQKIILHVLIRLVYKGDGDIRARGGVNAVTSDPKFDTTFGAQTLIILLADRRAIGGTELDIGMCGQNMVLAAHAMGLGACYIGLIPKALKFSPRIKKRLGITHPFEAITSLVVGYPLGKIDAYVNREKPRINWIS